MMRPAVAAVIFACLLVVLAATSTPRVVGDGSEYVHLASRLATGHLPGPGESRHFIVYPALASPLIRLGFTPTTAFTILNGLLLVAAAYAAASRLHWTWCAFILIGPILWWLDKPHTEPFTFAMYALAFALLETAPWWSLAAAGAAIQITRRPSARSSAWNSGIASGMNHVAYRLSPGVPPWFTFVADAATNASHMQDASAAASAGDARRRGARTSR
jgi:hypothetical protein